MSTKIFTGLRLFRIRPRSTIKISRSIMRYNSNTVSNVKLKIGHTGMNLQEVVTALNRYAPLHLSEPWDNTGLLLEPSDKSPVSKILLTNDLTLDVMKEAEDSAINLIISYHPPLFQKLNRITSKNWKERIIARCLGNGIAVYSPHTCYDALKGGVNDWLISAFGKGDCSPITYSYQVGGYSHHIKIIGKSSENMLQPITTNLQSIDSKRIKIAKGNGMEVDVFCRKDDIPSIISKISDIQDQFDQYQIYKLETAAITDTGMGRKLELDDSITVSQAIIALKSHLNLNHIRLSLKHGGSLDDSISTIAVCAGSGLSVLTSVIADLYVTGEMSHHEVLNLAQNGRTTLVTEHSNSERGFLNAVLKPDLEAIFKEKNIAVTVSETDCDPYKIV